ncbi:MAG: cupin domain-containing protein [Gammaproteobacteria bacterium]|nr:cupin domain-containing protein [Gammaproteobacteria bacterium]
MADSDAQPTWQSDVAQVYDLHLIKAFATDRRVRRKLFKTGQLWAEIACYEPGQSTVMHHHPFEEETIYVLEGVATMNIAGDELVLPAGSVVRFDAGMKHDVRNLHDERCVIVFLKIPTRLARRAGARDG